MNERDKDEDYAYELRRQQALDESACESEPKKASITAVGAALLLLEQDMAKVLDAEEMLIAKKRLLTKKMRILHESMRLLFLQHGFSYTPVEPRRFPELHIED